MQAIWSIIIEPAWYWLITIVPAVLGFVGAIQDNLPANQRSRFMAEIYDLLPYWAWLLTAAFAFVVTILISANNYVKKHSKESKDAGMQSVNQSGGITGNIRGSTIHQGDNISFQTREAEPPIVKIEGEPYIKKSSLNMSLYKRGSDEIIPIFINVLFAQLSFANNPKIRNADSTAKNVRARITYLKTDRTVIATLSGRWASERGSRYDEEIVDLLSNGKPRILYLAMKYDWEHDQNLYMYGMETDASYFGKRHEDDTYRLYEDQVDIKVDIIGERVELTEKFRLYDEATGLRIETLTLNP